MSPKLKETYDRLFSEGIMTRYHRCPVCGEQRREPVQRRLPRQDWYMRALSAVLGVDYGNLMEMMEVFLCGRCRSIYCDPWLSASGMSMLYGRSQSQHLLGWDNFFGWVQGHLDSVYHANKAQLWDLLSGVAGRVTVYGELNCPFEGLFMYFKDLESPPRRKIDEIAETVARIHETYIHPKGIKSARVEMEHSYRRLLTAVCGHETAAVSLPRSPSPLPDRRFLVFEPSIMFWSTNCVSLDCSCRALGHWALNAPVIGFQDVVRERIEFDVLGMFNCLDHFVDPVRVLRMPLNASRLVFLEVHRSDPKETFSRQHLFAFGRDFLEHVCEEGWNWVNLSQKLKDPLQDYYLVSKTADL